MINEKQNKKRNPGDFQKDFTIKKIEKKIFSK